MIERLSPSCSFLAWSLEKEKVELNHGSIASASTSAEKAVLRLAQLRLGRKKLPKMKATTAALRTKISARF
jgi:hypothetical protein